MKVWTTKGRSLAAIIGIFLSFAAPTVACASVQFTEIMYDAPGADTGREWIEITNTGQSSVDIAGYKLFESGVNHNLTPVQGTTTLAAGESAIITADGEKFLADYPAYTGAIFKSPFSLLNTSGSFALKDKTLAVVDSASYSAAMGAAGDGNSLHLNGVSWIPGAPNPGSNAPTQAIAKTAPTLAAASVPKTIAAKTTAKTSSNAVKNSAKNSASVVLGVEPLVKTISPVWLYALGLAACGMLAVAAVLYVRQTRPKLRHETDSEAAEFELE
jgi:hypothetical protein